MRDTFTRPMYRLENNALADVLFLAGISPSGEPIWTLNQDDANLYNGEDVSRLARSIGMSTGLSMTIKCVDEWAAPHPDTYTIANQFKGQGEPA